MNTSSANDPEREPKENLLFRNKNNKVYRFVESQKGSFTDPESKKFTTSRIPPVPTGAALWAQRCQASMDLGHRMRGRAQALLGTSDCDDEDIEDAAH